MQFVGVVAAIIFTAAATYAILKLVGAMVGLRVDEEEEIQGLDIVCHEETGYNL